MLQAQRQATRRVRRMRARLLRFVGAVFAIAAVGTVGYVIIEGWALLDALYMTVITLSTVGFTEVRPLSSIGRAFTAGLIIAGVGSVTYLFAAIGQNIISGELTGSLRKARMQRRIDDMKGHYIICGFGRVGQQVAVDLQAEGAPCVVVDERESALGDVPSGVPSLQGDASDDELLRLAGVERAAGLVATTGDDAVNLMISLSARTLNPALSIVARANQPASEPKLLRAGATQVISPYTISGRRIARQLLRPSIIDFLDVVMHTGQLELVLEECHVRPDSDLHGKTVAEAEVRKRTGANVLAVRRHDQGAILTNPPAEMRFEPDDLIIALGTADQLGTLSRLAGDATGVGTS